MSRQDPDAKEFLAFLRMAIVPTLILKVGILYFGMHYSLYPGEGYGYGLAFLLAFSVVAALIFTLKQTRRRKHD